MGEKLKDRYLILSIAFLLVGIRILIQLADLQIVQGKELDQKSKSTVLADRSIQASRGNIFDRYGVPLATNEIGYSVQITKVKMKTADLNKMLLELAKVLEKNGDSYSSNLSKYLTFNPVALGSEIAGEKKQVVRENWKKDIVNKSEHLEMLNTPEGVFEYLRKIKFSIDDKYTDEEAYKIMTLRYELLYKQGYKYPISKNVSKKTMAEIEERHFDFPGVITDVVPVRKYLDGTAVAHVLGYIRNLNPDEYQKNKENGYKLTDMIGKTGIELAAESYLKGKDGRKWIEQDTSGRQTRELGIDPAIPGNDVVLTLDMQLQKVAMESLERNINEIKSRVGEKHNFGDAFAGSAVAIDVNTGEVLVMASYPSYDPSIFLKGTDDAEAQQAINDLFSSDNVNTPAVNRAISSIYFPGSTYKPITAIAALETGVITPESSNYYDSGTETIGNWKFTCLEYKNGQGAHHLINLTDALATSCNLYFQHFGSLTGIDNLDKWAKMFGLGEKTGIDIGNEKAGHRANKEYKKKTQNGESWYPADTAQASIGQFDNSFTPIQLANYISTLSNGGKFYKPHLIKKVVKYDGSTVFENMPEYTQIPISERNVAAVKAGMLAVANAEDGTAKDVFKNFPMEIAGKTGTPETGREAKGESSDGLFVCYAPADKPQIAIAVVIERGVWGANAAPVARDILTHYFHINENTTADDVVTADRVVLTR